MVFLLTIIALPIAAPDTAHAQDIRGTVQAGSVSNEAGITVRNPSSSLQVEGAHVTVVDTPGFLTNVRIAPESPVSVPPGESQDFTVTFDALPNIPAGQTGTLNLHVRATKGAVIEPSQIRVTVTIEEATTAGGTTGPSGPQQGEGTRPRSPTRGTAQSTRPSDQRSATNGTAAIEYEWYVIFVRGSGLILGSGQTIGDPAVVHRKKGSHDFIRQVRRGENLQVVIQEVRTALAKPWCGGVHTGPVDFFEDVNVRAVGPFQSSGEARAKLQGDTWNVVEAIPNMNAEEALRRFGCGGGPVATADRSSSAAGGNRPRIGVSGTGTAGGTGSPPGGGENRAPASASPGTPEPKSAETARLIQQWLAVAEPPLNAKGARLHYDDWGRVVGTGVNREIITAGAPPGGNTSTAYVWTLRDKLDSINHCTLGEYVLTMLQGGSTSRCDGRYKAAPPQTVATVPVEGLDWKEAEQKLKSAGFIPELTGGDPPRTKAEGNTVQWQKPKAGEPITPGNKVLIAIHPPYVEQTQSVPDVRGRDWKAAQSELEHAGFKVALRGGDPSKQNPGTIQDQDPKPGPARDPNATVTLRIYTASAEPTRPISPSARAPVDTQREAQPTQQCNALLKLGDDAYNSGRLEESRAAYRHARDLRCAAPDLPGAIAGVEQAIGQRNRQVPQQQGQAGPAPVPSRPSPSGTGEIQAILVSQSFGGSGNGSDPYQSVTISVVIDAARLQWIAWNDRPEVSLTVPSRPQVRVLGPGGFGTDDYFDLTITRPSSESFTVKMDQNDGDGYSFGPQNVIFGSQVAAPDVYRKTPFGPRAGQEQFFNEAGAFNSVFTESGQYQFRFDFRDNGRGRTGFGHGPIYLLVGTRDAPMTAVPPRLPAPGQINPVRPGQPGCVDTILGQDMGSPCP